MPALPRTVVVALKVKGEAQSLFCTRGGPRVEQARARERRRRQLLLAQVDGAAERDELGASGQRAAQQREDQLALRGARSRSRVAGAPGLAAVAADPRLTRNSSEPSA